jgi:uncharacterized protein (TIGR02757 family)
MSQTKFRPEALKAPLDRLYSEFNHPDSAFDPVQVVRRYSRVEDREVVAFIAAGLAFGRVASIVKSIEAMCQVLGESPAAFVRAFEPKRHGGPLVPLVHRWTRGADFVALLWMLRRVLERHGSIEHAFASGNDASAEDVGPAIDAFCNGVRAIDVTAAYGRAPRSPGVFYFLARPSTGSACKRINLFLRWMVRQDKVDPGGWTSVPARQLVVPLDTHIIRAGKCLGLTRRASPGWRMAAEITAGLRQLDPVDPVRYDFALCHLSMKGLCGFGTRTGNARCPLRECCQPGKKRSGRA